MIGHLRRELDARGLRSMGQAASDEYSYTGALATWLAFDDDTRKAVTQVGL